MVARIAVKERKLHRNPRPHLHVDHVRKAKTQTVNVKALRRLHIAYMEHNMAEALIAHEKSFYPDRRHHRRVEAFGSAEVDFDLDSVWVFCHRKSGNTAPLGD